MHFGVGAQRVKLAQRHQQHGIFAEAHYLGRHGGPALADMAKLAYAAQAAAGLYYQPGHLFHHPVRGQRIYGGEGGVIALKFHAGPP